MKKLFKIIVAIGGAIAGVLAIFAASKSSQSKKEFNKRVKANNEKLDFITRDIVKDNPKKIFIFGDNDEKTGYGGQAKEMRGEINTIGIPTKKKPTMELDSFYSDEEFDVNKKKINFAISQMLNKVKEGYDIVIPSNGIGTGLSQLNIKAPKTYPNYKSCNLME